jgi:hypothetical protein
MIDQAITAMKPDLGFAQGRRNLIPGAQFFSLSSLNEERAGVRSLIFLFF